VDGPDRIREPNYLFLADQHRSRLRNYLANTAYE
jgi:hypothetical protein